MRTKPILSTAEIQAIIYGMHGAPFSLLGMHETGPKKPGVVVRVFRPYATQVELIRKSDGQAFDMPRIHEDGLYELFFADEKPFAYKLRLTWFDKTVAELEDPYRFPLQLPIWTCICWARAPMSAPTTRWARTR